MSYVPIRFMSRPVFMTTMEEKKKKKLTIFLNIIPPVKLRGCHRVQLIYDYCCQRSDIFMRTRRGKEGRNGKNKAGSTARRNVFPGGPSAVSPASKRDKVHVVQIDWYNTIVTYSTSIQKPVAFKSRWVSQVSVLRNWPPESAGGCQLRPGLR